MMKLKLKVAVAAIALATSVSANAAMTNAASGDSSLILTLLDNTNNISATFDLGQSYSTFPAAGSQSWDLTSGDYAAAWNSFLGTADPSIVKWAVYSGDNVGSGAGSRGMITSYAYGTTTTLSQSSLSQAMAGMDTYINANNPLGTHPTALNGASSAISGNAFAESGTAYGTTGRVGNVTTAPNAMKGLDQSMDVVQLQFVGTNNLAYASFTTLGNQYGNSTFNMSSNGVLSYNVAVVPEADISGMLLAGLGLMGFIARRRTRITA